MDEGQQAIRRVGEEEQVRGAGWQVEAVTTRANQVERYARLKVGIWMRWADEKLKAGGLRIGRVERDPEKWLGREVRVGQANLPGRRNRGRAAIAFTPDQNLSA